MWDVGPPSTACRRRGAGHVIATFGPPWCECPSRTNICLSLPRDNRHQCECRQLRDRGAVCAAVAAVRVEGRTNPFRVCDRLMRGKANPRPVYEISEAELRDIIQRERSGSASDAGEPFAEVDIQRPSKAPEALLPGLFSFGDESSSRCVAGSCSPLRATEHVQGHPADADGLATLQGAASQNGPFAAP